MATKFIIKFANLFNYSSDWHWDQLHFNLVGGTLIFSVHPAAESFRGTRLIVFDSLLKIKCDRKRGK